MNFPAPSTLNELNVLFAYTVGVFCTMIALMLFIRSASYSERSNTESGLTVSESQRAFRGGILCLVVAFTARVFGFYALFLITGILLHQGIRAWKTYNLQSRSSNTSA
jgi:hypothetical protein